jgi:hypothetical protein
LGIEGNPGGSFYQNKLTYYADVLCDLARHGATAPNLKPEEYDNAVKIAQATSSLSQIPKEGLTSLAEFKKELEKFAVNQ